MGLPGVGVQASTSALDIPAISSARLQRFFLHGKITRFFRLQAAKSVSAALREARESRCKAVVSRRQGVHNGAECLGRQHSTTIEDAAEWGTKLPGNQSNQFLE